MKPIKFIDKSKYFFIKSIFPKRIVFYSTPSDSRKNVVDGFYKKKTTRIFPYVFIFH